MFGMGLVRFTELSQALLGTRIVGRFAPFILVGSPLHLRPLAHGMEKVEQVLVGSPADPTNILCEQ